MNHHPMGGDVDDDNSDNNGSDDDDTDEEVDHVVAVVTDDEYEVSYWNEELVSDAAEDCDHGTNCCHVWCEAWEEERDASCIFAEREDLDNLWEKRLSLMWDERLKEEEELRRGMAGGQRKNT